MQIPSTLLSFNFQVHTLCRLHQDRSEMIQVRSGFIKTASSSPNPEIHIIIPTWIDLLQTRAPQNTAL